MKNLLQKEEKKDEPEQAVPCDHKTASRCLLNLMPVVSETVSGTLLNGTFLPDICLEVVHDRAFSKLPFAKMALTVVLFADISGFTALTETYSLTGALGIEALTRTLNHFFGHIIQHIFSAGGDIFKFAGDALFCIWKVDDDSTLAETIQTVVDCSLNIQKNYGEWPTCIGVTLRVKIGIATGLLEYHFFNDEYDSVHYSASGSVVEYVRNAEMLCTAGDTILTTEAWRYLESKGIHTRYTYTALPEDMVKVLCFDPAVTEEDRMAFTSAFTGVRPALYALNFEDAPLLKRFISPVVVNIKTQEELIFLSEMRHVTIVFVCMPDFIDIDLGTLSALYRIVSAALKETDGVLNKVITFDKGCSFLAVFGLPGYKGKNETCNALMCCNKLVHEVSAMNIKVTAGITSGMTFCGIIGHPLRQEYTVIGRKVNLAARLMSKYSDYLMVCDEDTYQRSVLLMGPNNFKELEWRKLKGIEHMGRVFQVKITTEEEVMDEIAEFPDVMMGMVHEREVADNFLTDFLTKRRMPKHMLLLRGETGCGKSHLLAVTVKLAIKKGFKTGTCHASVRTMRNPFSSVCFLLSRLLYSYGLNPEQENNTILDDILGSDSSTPLVINKGVIRLKNAPTLKLATAGSLADVSWQNKSLAQAKDHFIAVAEWLCGRAPCVLAVDDANYMDTLSWELLDKFGQLTSQYPCVVAMTSIPHSERVQQPLQIQKIMAKSVLIVEIQPLNKEYIPDFCFQRLQIKGIHNQILRLLKEYTKGNPAAMVEIMQVLKQKGLIHNINSTTVADARLKREFTLAKEDEHELREHRPGEGYMICDVVGEGLKDDVQVPDSLQALTVVRMEMLNEQEIVLLKKASVCGKAFEVSLLKLLSPTITTAEINGAIKKLVEQHFVTCSANTTTSFVYLLEGKVQDSPECPQCGQVGSLMRFHSAAVHKTIYGTLTYDSKAEIHQDIATCLEENALQCRFCKEYLSVEVYSSATDEFLMQSPPDKADLRVCKCHKTKANAYGQIGNHYYMSGMRGRALEAFLSAAQCSLEVDDVKKAEEYLESSENVFKASSWENVDERYLKLKRIAISRMRATIQLYYGNVDASLQEIKLAFQWLGRNIPKDYRKNASNYALRVVQCCRVDEIEEEEFCLQTAARVFLNRRDPRVALDVSSHFWELVTCRNAPLYKKMPAISLVIESSHYVHIAYKKQKKLEDTAIKDCIHSLEVDKHPRVSDLVAVLNTLIKIVEVRFLRTEITSAVDVGYEAFRIALGVHYTSMLLKILPYLAQTLLYSKNHSKCREVLSHLRHVAEVAEDTVGMALYYGGLAELLVHQFGIDVPALDNVQELYKTCLEFAISQCSKAPYTHNNEIEFYLTAAMAMWTSSCGLDQSCKEWLRRAKELKRSFHWRSSYWGRRAQRHLSEIKWK